MSYVVPADLLAQISDADFYRELTRRNLSKRGDKVGGRPKKLVKCGKCGLSMGARDLRVHKSQCEGKAAGRKQPPLPPQQESVESIDVLIERALQAQRNG